MREANLQASRNGPCPVVGSGVSTAVGPRKVSDRAWEGRASIQGSHGWGSRKTRRESRQFRQPALGRWAGGRWLVTEVGSPQRGARRQLGSKLGRGWRAGAGQPGKRMRTAQSLKPGKERLADPEITSEPRTAVPPSLDPQTSTGTFLKPETEARTPRAGWQSERLGGGSSPVEAASAPQGLCPALPRQPRRASPWTRAAGPAARRAGGETGVSWQMRRLPKHSACQKLTPSPRAPALLGYTGNGETRRSDLQRNESELFLQVIACVYV